MTNGKSQFIGEISITGRLTEVLEVELYSSNERIPENWTRVLFNKRLSPMGPVLQLRRPINDCHFRLNFIKGATGKSDIQLKLGFTPPDSREAIEKKLKQKRIIFLGCARNCLSQIEQSVAFMESLGGNFAEFEIVVLENDSSDGTGECLRDLMRSRRLRVIQKDGLACEFPERTVRLSYCRNLLLDYAKSTGSDYVCVCDLDGVVRNPFDMGGFLSNFEFESAWDAIFPVNSGMYYDIWALRHSSICPFDYERAMNLVPPSLGAHNALNLYLYQRQNLNFSALESWLRVESAFGGMGLYKAAALDFCNYYGFERGYQICEHTVLHENMRALGAALYINPRFVINGI